MNTKKRKAWHWLKTLLTPLFLQRQKASSHPIRGIQARFILARPGAGSLGRIAAEKFH